MATALAYRRQTEKVLACGGPAERKRTVRAWVEGITTEPGERVVEVRYRVPEVVVSNVVPGAGLVAIQNMLAAWLVGRLRVLRRGGLRAVAGH